MSRNQEPRKNNVSETIENNDPEMRFAAVLQGDKAVTETPNDTLTLVKAYGFSLADAPVLHQLGRRAQYWRDRRDGKVEQVVSPLKGQRRVPGCHAGCNFRIPLTAVFAENHEPASRVRKLTPDELQQLREYYDLGSIGGLPNHEKWVALKYWGERHYTPKDESGVEDIEGLSREDGELLRLIHASGLRGPDEPLGRLAERLAELRRGRDSCEGKRPAARARLMREAVEAAKLQAVEGSRALAKAVDAYRGSKALSIDDARNAMRFVRSKLNSSELVRFCEDNNIKTGEWEDFMTFLKTRVDI